MYDVAFIENAGICQLTHALLQFLFFSHGFIQIRFPSKHMNVESTLKQRYRQRVHQCCFNVDI